MYFFPPTRSVSAGSHLDGRVPFCSSLPSVSHCTILPTGFTPYSPTPNIVALSIAISALIPIFQSDRLPLPHHPLQPTSPFPSPPFLSHFFRMARQRTIPHFHNSLTLGSYDTHPHRHFHSPTDRDCPLTLIDDDPPKIPIFRLTPTY